MAAKQIDIDTKDFLFIPDDEDSKWLSWFIQKEFRSWCKKTYFGELINDMVENYPRYGTLVVKKVGKELQRVALKNVVNQQDAKDIPSMTHFMEVHENMTLDDMKKYPDWNTLGTQLNFGQKTTVYERYGRVPLQWFNKQMGKEGGGEYDTIEALVVCTLFPDSDNKTAEGNILFVEQADKADVYKECHWKRQDGRWLGIGEVENLFENQISRNMIANLRRRALLWSSKKIFQSPDDTVARNLIRDVKDGDVLKIAPNGNITQVDMASREVGEFQSTEEIWEKNSDQKSFTYEVATGESMPSGTPFRLGVQLASAVNSHFGMKKEKLGLFLKKLITEFVYKIFLEQSSKEHTVALFGDEEGMIDLKKTCSTLEYNKRITDWALSDSLQVPDFEAWKMEIEQGYKDKTHLFVEMDKDTYKQVGNHVELVITGEERDVDAEITTLSTLYQTMIQAQDPRADQVLESIFELRGKTLESVLGQPKQSPVPVSNTPVQQQVAPQMPQPVMGNPQPTQL